MPFTKQEDRDPVDALLDQVFERTSTKGDINYCITKLVHLWALKQLRIYHQGKKKYKLLDEAMGIFSSARDVFFRTILGPYEDKAGLKNGCISELDKDYFEDMRRELNKAL